MEIVRLDGCTEYRWPLLFCPGSSFRSRLSLGDGTGNGPMISLRPSLITEHHSVSSLNGLLAKPRHAQGISAQLAMWTRPAPWDVTFTSRWRQSQSASSPELTSRIRRSIRSKRRATVRRFGRSDRSAQAPCDSMLRGKPLSRWGTYFVNSEPEARTCPNFD